MSNKPVVHVHADESCLGNQFQDRDNPGGAGGLLEHWTGAKWERRDFWISEPGTTNNRMALRSAIEALGHLTRPSRLIFVSDSQYLVKGMTEWLRGWKAKKWTRKAGPIENLELWKRLDAAVGEHEVEWRWVRGHAGHPKNEYANHLATGAAKRQDHSEGPRRGSPPPASRPGSPASERRSATSTSTRPIRPLRADPVEARPTPA
jgi:ribonuclease HI